MRAPLFLVEPGELPSTGDFRLTGPEGRHAAKVRRLRVGERVDLGDGAGRVAECVVREVGSDDLSVEVVTWRTEPEPEPRFVVAQALAKGDRGELAVELMTEAGVDTIVPWAAQRSVVQWSGERGERPAREPRWAAHGRGRRPSRRAASRVPEIEAALGATLPSAREASLGGGVGGRPARERDRAVAGAADPGRRGGACSSVGPEGGVSEAELTALRDAGARVCRLGPEILRTSTAGVVALAVLSARSCRWDPPSRTDDD